VIAQTLVCRKVGAGLIHHRDRGSQYARAEYRSVSSSRAHPGMSQVANCWDNTVVESFFTTLKTELPTTLFASHQAARSGIFDDVACCYNRQRRHSTLGYQTSVEAERAYFTRQRAA
jgi:putative transposase